MSDLYDDERIEFRYDVGDKINSNWEPANDYYDRNQL